MNVKLQQFRGVLGAGISTRDFQGKPGSNYTIPIEQRQVTDSYCHMSAWRTMQLTEGRPASLEVPVPMQWLPHACQRMRRRSACSSRRSSAIPRPMITRAELAPVVELDLVFRQQLFKGRDILTQSQ